MITLKSKREIELMDKAGTIVALVHKKLKEVIVPGISTAQIDKICEEVIRENGGTPSFKGLYDFPGAVCTSVNDILVHGIPSHSVILKDVPYSPRVRLRCGWRYYYSRCWSLLQRLPW